MIRTKELSNTKHLYKKVLHYWWKYQNMNYSWELQEINQNNHSKVQLKKQEMAIWVGKQLSLNCSKK